MESCGDTVIPKEISKEWNTTCESRVSCQGRHLVLPFYFSPGAPCGSIRINSSAYLIALGAPLGVVNLPIRKQRVLDSGVLLPAADGSEREVVAKFHAALHHAVLYTLLNMIWNEGRLIATYADLVKKMCEHLGCFVDQWHSVSIFHGATVHRPYRNRLVSNWDSWKSQRSDLL